MTGLSLGAIRLKDLGPLVEVRFGLAAEHEEYRRGRGETVPDPVRMVALIDTGASFTVLAPGTFARLGVQATDATSVRAAGSPPADRPSYVGRLFFLRGEAAEVAIVSRAIEIPELDRFGAILGRDTLAHGRFIYDGRAGNCGLVLKGVEVPLLDPAAEGYGGPAPR